MSVPAAGHPGAEYFSNGAAVMSVPAAGQPGAEYFSNGAAVMSVPAPGQPGAEYFSNGAAVMSVPRSEWFKMSAAPLSAPAEQPALEEPPLMPSTSGNQPASVETAPLPATEASTPADVPADTSVDLPSTPLPLNPRTASLVDDAREQVEAERPARQHVSTAIAATNQPDHEGFYRRVRVVTLRTLAYVRAFALSIGSLLAVLVVLAMLGWKARAHRRHLQ
jgi:hypothetical protein